MKTRSKNSPCVLLIFTSLLTFAFTSQAVWDIVANFDFEGGSFASVDTSVNSITSLATATASTGTPSIVGNELRFVADTVNNDGNLTDLTIGPGTSFVSFSVEVTGLAAGETFDFESLDFFYQLNAPLNFSIAAFTSVEGFSAGGQLLGSTTSGSGGGLSTFSGSSTLTDPGYLGLSNGDIVTFGIYVSDTSGSSGRSHDIDNIIVQGSVNAAVPEPSSFAIFAIGGVLTLVRRRKNSL